MSLYKLAAQTYNPDLYQSQFGIDVKHKNVGMFFGSPGVNGAVAKDTGHSLLNQTVGQATLIGAGLGTGIGAVDSAFARDGLKQTVKTIGSHAGKFGAGAAAIAAATYGLGHLFGDKQPQNKNIQYK